MVRRNNHFAYSENILIAILEDKFADTQNVGVTKVLALRKQIAEENEENKRQGNCSNAPKVVQFVCFMFQLQTWKQKNITS